MQWGCRRADKIGVPLAESEEIHQRDPGSRFAACFGVLAEATEAPLLVARVAVGALDALAPLRQGLFQHQELISIALYPDQTSEKSNAFQQRSFRDNAYSGKLIIGSNGQWMSDAVKSSRAHGVLPFPTGIGTSPANCLPLVRLGFAGFAPTC